jgi:hypothetical protein
MTQTNIEAPALPTKSNLELPAPGSVEPVHIEFTDQSSPEAHIDVNVQHLGEVAVEEPK